MHSILSLLKDLQQAETKSLFTSDGNEVSARQFLSDIKSLSAQLAVSKNQRWALCYHNSYLFIVALFAVLHARQIPVLLPNNQKGTIQAFLHEFDGVLSEESNFKLPRSNQNKFQITLDENQTIIIFTSGSTGQPKKVQRSLKEYVNEIEILEQTFGAQVKNSFIYSTVSHQHIYGLLFYLLWPLCADRIINFPSLNYPESIESIIPSDHPITLISSPAFLSRMPNKIIEAKNLVIFSSGNLLKRSDALRIYQTTGIFPIEVLGSTETGGVAFRQQTNSSSETAWQAFSGVTIQMEQDSHCLKVSSPFFQSVDGFVMGDEIRINQDNTFQLLGRADRIAKIEGKRISLSEIEEKLTQHKFIEEAYAISMEANRQYIAVIIILTSEGMTVLQSKGKRFLNLEFTDWLSQYFERVLLPKRLRYLDKIPVNPQGKITRIAVEKLFENNSIKYPKVVGQQQLEKQNIMLQLFVSKEIEYFHGHFPSSPILPGVVQIDWAIFFANQFFGIAKEKIVNIDQAKFTRAILPERTVHLSLQLDRDKLNFKYFDEGKVYSSGKIRVSA